MPLVNTRLLPSARTPNRSCNPPGFRGGLLHEIFDQGLVLETVNGKDHHMFNGVLTQHAM